MLVEVDQRVHVELDQLRHPASRTRSPTWASARTVAGSGWRPRPRDGVAVRAGGGVAQDLHQAGLDLVGDDVLPAVRLGVDLVPGQPDDVGQEPFGQAVLADDAGGQLRARGS